MKTSHEGSQHGQDGGAKNPNSRMIAVRSKSCQLFLFEMGHADTALVHFAAHEDQLDLHPTVLQPRTL